MVIRTHECSLLLWSSLENRPFIRQTTGRALVELAATIKTWYDGSPRYRLTPFRTQCLLKRHRERIPPILCVTEEFTLFAQTSDWVFVADKLVSLVFFVLGPFVATVNVEDRTECYQSDRSHGESHKKDMALFAWKSQKISEIISVYSRHQVVQWRKLYYARRREVKRLFFLAHTVACPFCSEADLPHRDFAMTEL